jgi:hypothetical protein
VSDGYGIGPAALRVAAPGHTQLGNATRFRPEMSQGLTDVGTGLTETAAAAWADDATHQKFQT